MCKVYNEIGSLTTIKTHLRNHDINDFKSVSELIEFQNNYSTIQQQILYNHSILIENEKEKLSKEIPELQNYIDTSKEEFKQKLEFEHTLLTQEFENLNTSQSNIFQLIRNYFKKKNIRRKILDIEINFDSKVYYSIEEYSNILSQNSNRLQYIINHFTEAIKSSASLQLGELERKWRIIDEITTSIYGAIGEQKVAKELEKLSDDYILINDFSCAFHRPLYYRQEDDYIKSIQIDHILVSPAGIFLIETKNWSEHSLNNLSLRSPIKQIKRTGFALFKIASDGMTNLLNQHHWGHKSIPIRNIIVLINRKPNEEFQYVKVLMLKELRNYIEYFKPCFSNKETQIMANYLNDYNGNGFYR